MGILLKNLMKTFFIRIIENVKFRFPFIDVTKGERGGGRLSSPSRKFECAVSFYSKCNFNLPRKTKLMR